MMAVGRAEASHVSGRTLEVFAGTPRFNRWMYAQIASGIRGEVLEVGSGIGNISRLIRKDATRLMVTDTEPHYLRALSETFAGDAAVDVAAFDLDGPPPTEIAARRFDAIVAINVIEHIEDDHGLVVRLAGLLRSGGQLLVYVPACPSAYGSLDVALGHHRRYTPETLAACLRAGGLDPGRPRYINLLGLAGWVVSGRILRRTVLPARSVRLFDHLVPLVRLADKLNLPVGLGLCTHATKGV